MEDCGLWQNTELRIDVDHRLLKLTAGENLVEKMENVERFRINDNYIGTVRITNFRIMWHARDISGKNTTIGLSSIMEHETTVDIEKYKGEVVFIHVRHENNAFKFVFKASTPEKTAHFYKTIQSSLKAYEAIKMSIDLVHNNHETIDESGNLRLLPMEQFSFRVPDVWLLGKPLSTLGFLFVTNWRLVWCSKSDHQKNSSISFHRISSFCIFNLYNFPVILIQTSSTGKGYFAPLKVYPEDKQTALFHQIQELLKSRQKNPICGTSFTIKDYLPQSDCLQFVEPMPEWKKGLKGETETKKTLPLNKF